MIGRPAQTTSVPPLQACQQRAQSGDLIRQNFNGKVRVVKCLRPSWWLPCHDEGASDRDARDNRPGS